MFHSIDIFLFHTIRLPYIRFPADKKSIMLPPPLALGTAVCSIL